MIQNICFYFQLLSMDWEYESQDLKVAYLKLRENCINIAERYGQTLPYN